MTAIADLRKAAARRPYYAQPSARAGLWSWFTTSDHKKSGILYGVTAFTFFVLSGLEALLIRVQLATPDGSVLNEALYNQIFAMHGLTMISFAVMPLSSAFSNYLLPLMIGARDVAFPWLNAFSYWAFLAGGLLCTQASFPARYPMAAGSTTPRPARLARIRWSFPAPTRCAFTRHA
jgi:cytochrome c oxidase subunit 1